MVALQTYAPEFGVPLTVAASCAAGISTSLALETAVLRATEAMAWSTAFSVAARMSTTSMLAMELAENGVELALTGGDLACSSAAFTAALPPALLAGFLVPLPYNYFMLRKHGKACH